MNILNNMIRKLSPEFTFRNQKTCKPYLITVSKAYGKDSAITPWVSSGASSLCRNCSDVLLMVYCCIIPQVEGKGIFTSRDLQVTTFIEIMIIEVQVNQWTIRQNNQNKYDGQKNNA